MNFLFSFDNSSVTKFNLKMISCLFILSLISVYLLNLGYKTAFGFIPLFNLDMEFNIPSFYSFISLLFCASLLHIIYVSNKKNRIEIEYIFYWKVLSYIFIYLSFDELIGLHEHIGSFISSEILQKININNLNASRNWIPLYAILLIIIIIFFFNFFISLSTKTKTNFFIAGSIYIFGAVILELIDGQLIVLDYNNLFLYRILSSFEELFEMLGITLFIKALLVYIENSNYTHHIDIRLLLKEQAIKAPYQIKH